MSDKKNYSEVGGIASFAKSIGLSRTTVWNLHNKNGLSFEEIKYVPLIKSHDHYNRFPISLMDYNNAIARYCGIHKLPTINGNLFNVLKYVIRYRFKNGIEDLQKARNYLDNEIRVSKAIIENGGKQPFNYITIVPTGEFLEQYKPMKLINKVIYHLLKGEYEYASNWLDKLTKVATIAENKYKGTLKPVVNKPKKKGLFSLLFK